MKNFRKKLLVLLLIVFLNVNATCQTKNSSIAESENQTVKLDKKKGKDKKVKLPNIDLNHWSVTTPELNEKGSATSVGPPAILNYATDERLLPYMYNDSTIGALVFYAFPSGATTTNTKYSRTELREQMIPGNNDTNWTFGQGGIMKGKLAMGEVSKDSKGKYHKVIIMQIHGRLTNEQRDLIGQKDNNAPPILKIYWQDGKIRVKTKELKNLNASATEILNTDAWRDDDGYTFKEEVGFKKFTLEVKVSEGKIVVVLNNNEDKVYENIYLKKWGVFENYFKAGNYLNTTDKDAFAKVKYYDLVVSH